MMFIKQIQKLFLFICIIASILLVYLWYSDYKFFNSSLDVKIKEEILKKEFELRTKAFNHFKINKSFPIIVSDKLPSNRYGMATYSQKGEIKIYLNKKRFKENKNYMIDDVMPHEYAHAIMFYLKDFSNKNSGHTKRWQIICKKLGGIRCDRFVNRHDILIEKTNIF